MTPQEAKKMLKAKLECLKRETSGTDIDCNYRNCDECDLCYAQGNMGEQEEALDMAIKALEQQRVGKWLAKSFHEVYCDNCGFDFDIMTNEFMDKMNYCPNCGACMEESEDKE